VELRPVAGLFGIEYGRVCLLADEGGVVDDCLPCGVGHMVLAGCGDGANVRGKGKGDAA
jgi:hypothetical protein